MAGVKQKRSAFEGLKGLKSQSKKRLSVVQQAKQPVDGDSGGNPNHDDSEELAKLVDWSAIVLPEKQPRRYFDETELKQLAASIREHGVLEPLIIRPLTDGKYGLVAGERRYRAAKLASLKQVPVTVRVLSEEQAWELALVENVQRQDLNAVDRTDAVLQALAFKLNCSIKEAKSALYRIENEDKGKVTRVESGNEARKIVERVFRVLGIRFSHFMRFELPLLKAPEAVLAAVRAGQIDVRHANEIRRVKDEEKRHQLLDEVIEQQLSVEAVRARVKDLKGEVVAREEDALQVRLGRVLARVRQVKRWEDATRRARLEAILRELEQLLKDEAEVQLMFPQGNQKSG